MVWVSNFPTARKNGFAVLCCESSRRQQRQRLPPHFHFNRVQGRTDIESALVTVGHEFRWVLQVPCSTSPATSAESSSGRLARIQRSGLTTPSPSWVIQQLASG